MSFIYLLLSYALSFAVCNHCSSVDQKLFCQKTPCAYSVRELDAKPRRQTMFWIFCLLNLSFGLLAAFSLTSSGDHYSAIATSKPRHYASQPYSILTGAKNQSYDQIPSVYVPVPTQERGACSIIDKYCSYNGTDRNPDGLSDQCMLWDNTCSGNQTLAIDKFFGQTQEYLYENVCFTGDGDGLVESNCTQRNTPARYSEFARIKGWMRSPQCIVSQGVYQKAHPAPDTEGMQGEKRAYRKRDNSTQGHNYGGGSCCGTCNIEAGNVDVYYWPVPNVNKSCLSIIGNSVNPPDFGATTDSLGLKWVHVFIFSSLSIL